MLDAEADLARSAALDRPPRVDRIAALRDVATAGRDRGWIRAFIAAMTGPGRLSADEAWYYGLDRQGVTPAEARAHVGRRVQHRMHAACNDGRWYAVAHDKALFYTVLAGAGLPAPETLALLGPRPRGGHRSAGLTAEALAAISDEVGGPVFAKPIAGMFSIGAMVIEGREDDGLRLRGHGAVPASEVATYMRAVSAEGYLVQRVLEGDPALPDGGSGVASLRLLVLAGEAPRLLSSVLKLPGADSVADNFWRRGNRLAAIDRETGTVRRAIVNDGRRIHQEDSGLAGLAVPGWQAACALALEAATLFPAIRTQSWDVALTRRGPVLLEFNFGGDLNLHQLAHGRGILGDEFRDHLRRCGYRGKLA